MNIHRSMGVVVALVMLFSHGLAEASDAANAKVKYRKDLMASAGGHMGALGCYMKGECQLEPKVLKRAANGIALMGTLSIPAFKNASTGATVNSASKPNVWSEWDDFKNGLQSMTQKAQALAVAADSGNRKEMGPAMKALGKGCKGCHDHFKEKKK